MNTLDIQANRKARKYTRGELLLRLLWALVTPLYRCSPRLPYGWRNLLLRLFGAKLGRGVRLHPRARVYFPWNLSIGDESTIGEDTLIYNLGPVTIGKQVTISHQVQLCAGTHDHTDPAFVLLKPPVIIGDGAWICTRALIGPGVTVGEGAIAGAGAVVMRDVAPWTIVAGNPAKAVGQRQLKPSGSSPSPGA